MEGEDASHQRVREECVRSATAWRNTITSRRYVTLERHFLKLFFTANTYSTAGSRVTGDWPNIDGIRRGADRMRLRSLTWPPGRTACINNWNSMCISFRSKSVRVNKVDKEITKYDTGFGMRKMMYWPERFRKCRS